jgi:hypothetical protein
MSQISLATQYIALAVFAIWAFVLVRSQIRYRLLPPGPRPLPLLGNGPHIPKSKPWLQMAEWAEQYGDRTSLASDADTYP